MSEYQIVLQGGAIAVFLLVFTALLRGHLRTQHEVLAWKERALRAEHQVDTLVPAVQSLTNATERQTDAIVETLSAVRGQFPAGSRK